MRGREFLDQARDSLPGNRPRQRRSAIIHAYYALLLECRDLMAQWGCRHFRGNKFMRKSAYGSSTPATPT
jgi:hypothetical protein